MTLELLNALAMRRTLVRRFIIAMLVVCFTTVATAVTIFVQLQRNERDAHLINISGRQRMLSQRIVLMAKNRLEANVSESGNEKFAFIHCIDTMQKSHDELSQDSRRISQLAELFEGEDGLDQMVSEFISHARDVSEGNGSAEALESLHRSAINAKLLTTLDEVVHRYEQQYDRKITRFRRLVWGLSIVSALALASLAIFVFIPTTDLVAANLEHLEQSNSELLEFCYRVSHDLKAPIVTATGITQLASDALDENDTQMAKSAIERANSSLQRVLQTVADIVDLIKQKSTEDLPETVRISEVIDEAREAVAGMPGYSSIDIKCELPDDDLVQTRRIYLKQTLENLLSNAVKYHDPAESQPTVWLSARKTGNQCVLTIDDNGLGIDEAFRSKVFKMFQRFHPNDAAGTGLGLYLVSQNARAMGGKISYRPRDKGSTFELAIRDYGA